MFSQSVFSSCVDGKFGQSTCVDVKFGVGDFFNLPFDFLSARMPFDFLSARKSEDFLSARKSEGPTYGMRSGFFSTFLR
jgi:hypothetical protein